MLSRLLELLQQGGTYRVADLAQRLDTTPQMVEAMLETLARMGTLRQIGQGCRATCEECPLAGLCAVGDLGRVWALAERWPADQER